MVRSTKQNVALIPARSGSKRLPNKNIKLLNGIPLIAYSITSAKKSKMFSEIIVSTDSEEIAGIARSWGASVPKLRPKEYSGDESSDIEWVLHCIYEMIGIPLGEVDNISILRPTSPLRSSESIVHAFEKLEICPWADSIRAMDPTSKHPGKMWILDDLNHAQPFLEQDSEQIPTYNMPTQSLQKLWLQNAALEIARLESILRTQTISGEKVLGLQLPEFEGLDINSQIDWDFLEFITSKNPSFLPKLKQ
jgi:N-acylneuraminate cytidylyltransferase